MSITRRLFLRNTAAAGATVTVGSAVAVAEPAKPLAPDERIAAAIEEIKVAFLEKWPNVPIRISDIDNGTSGVILIVTHCEDDKPGEVHHEREGLARSGGLNNG